MKHMQSHRKKLAWVCGFLSFMSYMFAIIGIAGFVLPVEALALIAGDTAGELKVMQTLMIAGIALAIGVVLNVAAYRLDRTREVIQQFSRMGIWFGSIFIALSLLSWLLTSTTSSSAGELEYQFGKWMSRLGIIVIAGCVTVLLVLLAALYLSVRYHPANRMGRLLQAGNVQAAISLGESKPADTRDIATNMNLISAYLKDGQIEKAQLLFNELEEQVKLPSNVSSESSRQAMDWLRKEIESCLETGG